RIMDGYRNVRTKRLQEPQMVRWKGIQFRVRRAENTYQLALDHERNRHFGKRGFFTADVVRIFANVGGVPHLTGASHVSHHTILPDLQAVVIAVDGATGTAVRAGQ